MTTASVLDAGQLTAVMVAYRDVLRTNQSFLNRLNVYPVPDGDTGTNMALTLESVVAELAPLDTPDMAAVCRAIAHGSLMGARGNSGVILSQLLRGVTERLSASEPCGGEELAGALVSASDLARKAVVRPVEGTILTVARAAGQGASSAADEGEAVLAVVERAQMAAAEALAQTPTMLEPLARAGVVDAGGAGYVLFFDAFLHVLDGRPLPVPADTATSPGAAAPHDPVSEHRAVPPGAPGAAKDVGALRYEVMYLLDAPDDTVAGFKRAWADIGDSIVVVGGDGLWNCHIHTDDIGAAIEAAIDIGRPHQIRVTDLAEQVEEERWVRDADDVAPAPADGTAAVTGVVAVVSGDGVRRIFHSLGVQRVVPGGQSMNPSTAQLLEAVESLPCAEVVILPNNPNIVAVARQVDALSTKAVRVVATGSIVEGFAALLAYDPGAPAEVNAASMEASASRVVPGAVTMAVRDADTEIGPVHAGDWIGLARDGVVAAGDSPAVVALRLLDALLGEGHEVVTVIEGDGSTPAVTRRITEWLHDEHPEVVAEVHHGGQPLYPYLLGIE